MGERVTQVVEPYIDAARSGEQRYRPRVSAPCMTTTSE